jgi:hypothetical protein
MRVVPRNQSPQITFFTSHLPVWAERAEEIGTTPELVAQLQAQVDAAREAFKAKGEAAAAKRSATLKWKIAQEAMLNLGAAVIGQVRAKAATDGEGIYSLASIDVPKKPAPIGEPGKPTEFRHTLSADGAVELSWKCKQPRGAVGTIYQVYRRIGMTGKFEYLGPTGERRYEDTTIPAGASELTYEVKAMRSTSVGAPAQYNVTFGGTQRPGELTPAGASGIARKAA